MKKFSGRRRYVAALAATAGLVAVAACGAAKPQIYGSSTEPSTQPSPAKPMPTKTMPGMSMPTSPSTSGAGAVVATKSVTIQNFAFGPASVTVKVGSTVTWTNGDHDAHTVTSQDSGGPLQSATINNGETYQHTFTKPGRYAYRCSIHPFMTGTVVVTP
jgi:plastocyanin